MHGLVQSSTRRRALLASALALSVLAASCGGTSKEDAADPDDLADACLDASCGESGLDEAGDPVRGGTLVYGIESETTGGFCLPEAQLAISGIMVARAFYDPLTAPNAAGGYSPYLASSVEPNDDYTQWKITVRDGVTFHDGTPLTGEVVKNNLDAYRGTYEGRAPLLLAFTLDNIASTSAEGQMVTVETKVPWVAFPAYLASARLGIMAQAQLDDADTCNRNLIGTGPFRFERWEPNDKLVGTRNEDYWQTAPDGEPYPYADGIEFRPLPDGQVRINSLESGDGVNVMHSSSAEFITGQLRELRDAGKINMLVSEVWAEPTFIQLNSTAPPFDDIRMREALARGLDRAEINERQNNGLTTMADGPFAPGSPAYQEDTGFPGFDPEAATRLVDEYVADGGDASFTLTATTDPAVVQFAEMIQQRLEPIGLKISIVKRKQAELIDDAIGKRYQAMLFRNYPGGDPDINYVWWYGEGNPVNFGGYDDPEINDLLDRARSETDPDARTELYQQISEEFADGLYSIWAWYTPWAVATDADVHGIAGPPLPGDDASEPGPATTDDEERQPSAALASGHSLIGLWVDQ